MPICPFLAGQALEPEVLEVRSAAFEDVCKKLGLADREDAFTGATRRPNKNGA
jgi:hypothetical protein